MINLGPYSGKNCPYVRFRPVVIDRILEILALVMVLAVWACIYWLYTKGQLSTDIWVIGGISTFCFVLIGVCSYLPVRFINFPVRVNEQNIGIQYLLAIRLTRIMNVILCLIFLSALFLNYYESAFYFFIASFILMVLAFIGYYILAYKYK